MERRLQPLLDSKKVSRDYPIPSTGTGVPRSADFFANSGANIALDVRNLAIKEADRIRDRADAEASKVADVLAGKAVREFFVYCQVQTDKAFATINNDARKIIEAQGAHVLTDMDEAAEVLRNAAATS